MKSSKVKSFLSSIILITITVFDIDVITILLQYLFSQKNTQQQHSTVSPPSLCTAAPCVSVAAHSAHRHLAGQAH